MELIRNIKYHTKELEEHSLRTYIIKLEGS